MFSRSVPSALAICSIVLAGVLVPQGVAYAESPSSLPTKVVHFADLNLNAPAGVKVLYRRIQRAAGDVCGPVEPVFSRIPSAASKACIRDAVKAAVRRIDRPMLTDYYAQRVGHDIDPNWQNTTARGDGVPK